MSEGLFHNHHGGWEPHHDDGAALSDASDSSDTSGEALAVSDACGVHPELRHLPAGCQGLARPAGRRGETRVLGLALAITLTFLVVEVVGSFVTGSLALLADAGHMLTDAGALGMALFASWIATRKATASMSYGYHRAEIVAALFNAAALIALAGYIVVESWHRFREPQEVWTGPMLVVAVIGLFVNLMAAWLLMRSQADGLNVQAALYHVAGDALGSLAAIGAGLAMHLWGVWIADPLASVVVAVVVLLGALRLLRISVDILLEGTPAHVDLARLQGALCEVEGVASVHDLHVWALSSGICAMSCHARLEPAADGRLALAKMTQLLGKRFGVEHTTIQVEQLPAEAPAALVGSDFSGEGL